MDISFINQRCSRDFFFKQHSTHSVHGGWASFGYRSRGGEREANEMEKCSKISISKFYLGRGRTRRDGENWNSHPGEKSIIRGKSWEIIVCNSRGEKGSALLFNNKQFAAPIVSDRAMLRMMNLSFLFLQSIDEQKRLECNIIMQASRPHDEMAGAMLSQATEKYQLFGRASLLIEFSVENFQLNTFSPLRYWAKCC